MTRYLVVPQWQGSPSSRAMQLIDGAQAIAGDLPRAATTMLDVPMEAGESLGSGIHRLSSLVRVRGMIAEALDAHAAVAPDEAVLTIGGDCGIALAPIAHAARRSPGLAVVWIDAHPDLNSPESSPSGAFAGMALRAVIGDGWHGLSLDGAVAADRVIVGGARSFDDPELDIISAHGITALTVDALRDPDALADAVAATGADAVYVHVDIDALDPAEIAGNAHPEPFGVTVAELTAALGRLRQRVPLVGASLAGYSPASLAAATDDLGAILRVIGALA
ncbi:arginase family protein [Microbacterium sp. M3]|uniref:Arginase family protein n=1 Tax=Microbacterium arthrosphaerae TaxID=792652 RepID=A0ABU4H1Q7_9MICO|nr:MULTISPECIES: arginase family protein [Microbacterium]MDW4573272.1 arginase family protein [Microbacterium arthrosphaerae]MDW7607127.1 arginase family protein [Microbacterium sp. M3]